MWRVHISRRINLLLGGEEEMLCARISYLSTCYGGIWPYVEFCINIAFIPSGWGHCYRSFTYEARRKRNVQSN